MVSWCEEDVEEGVASCVARSLLSVAEGDDMDCMVESVVAEVVDWMDSGRQVEDYRAALDDAGLMDMLVDMACEEDELSDLCEALSELVDDLRREPEEGDELGPGQCEMCEREAPITRHHVHPLKVHAYCTTHLKMTRGQLHETIGICRPCHNMVHRFADHKTLAEKYDSVEKLLAVPQLMKFVEWVQRQKVKPRLPCWNR
eukprot:TRINITY_DN640_c3_g1_i1.p1 TRINITY_DN640_c3_g1~~TRINITY_DN640_c3_g1_i1.p1  ORF type:complete len:201 (+),score=82.41 TRINITY_DN640_c3_g1_i1:50-652(+)